MTQLKYILLHLDTVSCSLKSQLQYITASGHRVLWSKNTTIEMITFLRSKADILNRGKTQQFYEILKK